MAVRSMAPVAPRRGAERARTGRLIHDSLGLLSSKWSVDVLLALGDGTRRYHQLLADLEPISEKVLTRRCARWSATASSAAACIRRSRRASSTRSRRSAPAWQAR